MMQPIATISHSARYAVIHFVYRDKSIIVEEAASQEYANRVLIAKLKETYMKSGYLCVFTPDRKHMLILDRDMNLIGLVSVIIIHRR